MDARLLNFAKNAERFHARVLEQIAARYRDADGVELLPPAPTPSGGPGTELKKLLVRFGIVASPTCGCNKMAARMDAAGPDGSEAMLPEIMAVMRTEAEKRGLPFIEAAARLLVKKAIRTARAAR